MVQISTVHHYLLCCVFLIYTLLCAHLNALSPSKFQSASCVSLQKAAMDRNDLCVENDQKKKVPSESSSSFPRDFKPLLDFSQLQPSQFGISVHSFIPSATPKGERSAALITQTCCCISMSDDMEPTRARTGVLQVLGGSQG